MLLVSEQNFLAIFISNKSINNLLIISVPSKSMVMAPWGSPIYSCHYPHVIDNNQAHVKYVNYCKIKKDPKIEEEEEQIKKNGSYQLQLDIIT